MLVLSASSELFPLIKTGGLADVTGALPKALKPLGVTTRTILPGYPGILPRLTNVQDEAEMVVLGESVQLKSGQLEDLNVIVAHCPALFERDGGPS